MRRFHLPKATLPFERARSFGAYVWEKPVDKYLGASRVLCEGRELLMLGGYSYLGLLEHPAVKAVARNAIDELGTGNLGAAALSGTTIFHKRIERLLADIWGRDEVILYPTGYSANLAVVNALTRVGDAVLIDVAAHMSLHDACAQSKARRVLFRQDDLAGLERKLQEYAGARNRLVVVDGVYSMDGSVCPLPQLVELCRKYDAFLLVDECHAFGMLPEAGLGVEEYFGLPQGSIDFRVATLSKAIPAAGGFVACERYLADYIRHHGHQNIFSGAQSGAVMAAAEAGIHLMLKHPHWFAELHEKALLFRTMLNNAGFDTGESETAIVPIIIDDVDECMQLAGELFAQGIYIQPVLFPAVKRSRLRAGISLSMSEADLVWAAQTIAVAYEKVKASLADRATDQASLT